MKVILASVLVSFLACLLLLPFIFRPLAVIAAPSASAASLQARNITCSSDDMRPNIAPFPRRAERALFASAATRIVFITALGDMMLAGSGLTVVAAPILKLASAKPRPYG